jgi:hypothetical protein
MEKGNIVDTGFYGTFAKASSISGQSPHFVYCPGTKSIFKLVENDENVIDLPPSSLDEKLITVSVSQLADACNQTVETVSGLLSGIRDEILDLVLVSKKNASLNFGFGVLNLRA